MITDTYRTTKDNLPVIPRTRNWMVIYTRSKWEKRVDQLLREKGIESFCPTIKRERQWADRKKMVEFPLFNSYVFVKVNPKEELAVRQTTGVVNFIYYCGKPAIVREDTISKIEEYAKIYHDLETINIRDIRIGNKVKIKDGVFSNHLGEVVKIEGRNILMIIEHLDCALTTKVNIKNIGLIN